MADRGRKISWRGVLILMGLFTMLAGLFGCKKNEPKPDVNNGIDEGFDFGVEGEDYSEDGPVEFRKILGIVFREWGYGPGFEYSIFNDDNNVRCLSYNDREVSLEEVVCPIDDETLDKVGQLCADLNIMSWNKFNRNAKGVLDGTMFSLMVYFEDDKGDVYASGSNCFPKNFDRFEAGIREIMAPLIEAELVRSREEKYENGEYSVDLTYAMINYAGRGASGSDSYSISVRDKSSAAQWVEITLESDSGEFIEPGTYRYNGDPDNVNEFLARLQEVVEKYKVYKWDGYDKSTEDYNDREWFQLCFWYEGDVAIRCCGCGDTEHYAEVREELMKIVVEYLKGYLDEKAQ